MQQCAEAVEARKMYRVVIARTQVRRPLHCLALKWTKDAIGCLNITLVGSAVL